MINIIKVFECTSMCYLLYFTSEIEVLNIKKNINIRFLNYKGQK